MPWTRNLKAHGSVPYSDFVAVSPASCWSIKKLFRRRFFLQVVAILYGSVPHSDFVAVSPANCWSIKKLFRRRFLQERLIVASDALFISLSRFFFVCRTCFNVRTQRNRIILENFAHFLEYWRKIVFEFLDPLKTLENFAHFLTYRKKIVFFWIFRMI